MKTKAQIEEQLKYMQERLSELNQADYPQYNEICAVRGYINALLWILSK